jgi:hypothetical protein
MGSSQWRRSWESADEGISWYYYASTVIRWLGRQVVSQIIYVFAQMGYLGNAAICIYTAPGVTGRIVG